jgi:hypothetical protein
MKMKKQKPVPFVTYSKVKMQLDAITINAEKTASILNATEREKDMISNLLVNTEKNLRATQEKMSFMKHEAFKMEALLDRYQRIIDVLIKIKE